MSRKQQWQLRSNGGQRTALYRYYQCQARTNQSVCDYHTRRAEELEEIVRQVLLDRGSNLTEGIPQTPDDAAVLKKALERYQQLQARLRRLNRQLEGYIDAATTGRISYDQLQKLGPKVTAQRLALMDQITEARQQLDQRSAAAQQLHRRAEALAHLTDQWDHMTPSQRQALLQQLVDRIVVTDDDIQVILCQ